MFSFRNFEAVRVCNLIETLGDEKEKLYMNIYFYNDQSKINSVFGI